MRSSLSSKIIPLLCSVFRRLLGRLFGPVQLVLDLNQNLSGAVFEGLDYEAIYIMDSTVFGGSDWGKITTTVNGTWLARKPPAPGEAFGPVQLVLDLNQNLSGAVFEGLDYEAIYIMDSLVFGGSDWGGINDHGQWHWLARAKFQPQGPAGQPGTQTLQALLYSLFPITFTWLQRCRSFFNSSIAFSSSSSLRTIPTRSCIISCRSY